ncbi:hypothetical protein RGQ21_67930 [Kitasatospora aureofaciens]|nr:hypothetical protein RGQ21_67930 [Kitasatospora aureofaciens]
MALSNSNGTWTLSHGEYQQLKRAYEKLTALEAAGVDNWEGYGHAMTFLYEEEEDE